MWRLYMRDHGIAIVTSYERMKVAIQGDDDVFVGFVTYVDYDNDWIAEGNMFSPFMHKRRSFEHEREVRGIIVRMPSIPNPVSEGEMMLDPSYVPPNGLAVTTDIAQLVEVVRVAPEAPAWFAEAVKDLTQRYGYDFPVQQSELGGEPVY